MKRLPLVVAIRALLPAVGFDGEDDLEVVKANLKKAQDDLAAANAQNEQLTSTQKKAQDDLKALQDKWGDLDADKVKSFMEKLENDEDAKLIAEGNVDAVITKRTEAITKALQKKADDATAAQATAVEERDAANVKLNQLIVSHAVRGAAIEGKVVDTAVEDVLSRAAAVFKVDDEGKVVPIDGTFGKDGKTLMTPFEWVDGMRDKAPHWFPAAQGAGARGGGTGGGGDGFHTITREQARDMQKYRAAKEAAHKAGVELRIVSA